MENAQYAGTPVEPFNIAKDLNELSERLRACKQNPKEPAMSVQQVADRLLYIDGILYALTAIDPEWFSIPIDYIRKEIQAIVRSIRPDI